MTTSEFNLEFDILYNNVASNAAPGLDEYEKSVFLTQAQESLVASLYGGQVASLPHFEGNESLRRYLDSLVVRASLTPTAATSSNVPHTDNSVIVNLPSELWFIVYESAKVSSTDSCLNNKTLEVVPIALDGFHRIKKNPFRGASSRRVLRLDIGEKQVELVCTPDYSVSTYVVEYVKRLSPIILTDLSSLGVSIDGQTTEQTCQLHPAVHRTILQNAVDLAIASMTQK